MTYQITQHKWFKPALFLAIGLLLGWILFGGSHENNNDHENHDLAEMSESGEEIWTCSMHPSVREDGPGSCPICGMDLIPASSESEEGDYSMVMTEASMSLADIQTAEITRSVPEISIYTTGKITPNEQTLSQITGNFHGRVTDLYVDFTGAVVEEGQRLFSIYSDDLISAQRELIEAAKNRTANPGLYRAAVQKLRYWDIRNEQIDAILQQGEPEQNMDIQSPSDGVVMARNITENGHVYEGDLLYEIADLRSVWVQFDLFESDVSGLQAGDQITFGVKSFPGEEFEGTVSFVDPTLDPNRRTARARVEVENNDLRLKPEMLVTGNIDVQSSGEQLLVPRSAVLWTGPRSLVYVKDSEADTPRFESREVVLGQRSGDYYIVEEGLEEGDDVVFNGAFKVDSEFQLADKFSMMNREPGSGAVPAGHQHGDMDETEMEEEDHSEHESESESQTMDDESSDEFSEEFTELLEIYLELKDDLIESNLNKAVETADQFRTELEEIGEHHLEGDAHTAWMESYSANMEQIESMAETDDIEEYREAFSRLSDQLIEDVKTFGIEGVVYHQYCPMAFDNEGADWLSRDEEIRNPYFGDQMMNCGEVIERIE